MQPALVNRAGCLASGLQQSISPQLNCNIF